MKPTPAPPSRPELLAPAGSLEAFFAAFENGADAVYCGLRDFSARAKAKNIALGDLPALLGYARSHSKQIYITVNTLIKEEELPQLAETLAELEAQRVNGVIIQDPAVWRLARRHFPALPLHASTQMTIHNAAGVRQLERLGFSRAVLARELSLAEIAAIRAATTLELEHFIHGALCYSFSGQCFFSSWLGGKSGNRGRCAQPCRRRYHHRREDGYYFSPNDLSAIDLLPELAAAGVCSFKIEGRMKSAEYVATVVGAYRRVLDAVPAERAAALKEAKERLKLSFGRPPTKGFLPGGVPTDMVIPSLSGATGRFLGEIGSLRGNTILFKTRDALFVGDRLRIQPKSDQAGSAFTVKELYLGQRAAKMAPAGSTVGVPSPFACRVGDGLYKVSSEQAFTLSEAACRRRLDSQRGGTPTALRLHIALAAGELRLTAEAGGATVERCYPVEAFAAADHPLDAAILHKVFAAGSAEGLSLSELNCAALPAVVIPPSRLKEIRRLFYRDVAEAVRRAARQQRQEHLQGALADLLPATPVTPRPRRLTVAIGDIRDAHIITDAAVDRVMLPLSAANLHGLAGMGRRLAGHEGKVIWDLPFILFDPEWQQTRSAVRQLVERGFRTFRLNNLGHFPLFDGVEGVELLTGYRLFSLNSQARLAWHELGASETTLYLEDDRANLAAVASRACGVRTALTVYAAVPVLTSRIPLRGVKGDATLVSDRGEAYRAVTRDQLAITRPEVDFSLLGRLDELTALGIEHCIVDLAQRGPFSPDGRKVLDAWRRGVDPPDTAPFNYERGME